MRHKNTEFDCYTYPADEPDGDSAGRPKQFDAAPDTDDCQTVHHGTRRRHSHFVPERAPCARTLQKKNLPEPG